MKCFICKDKDMNPYFAKYGGGVAEVNISTYNAQSAV